MAKMVSAVAVWDLAGVGAVQSLLGAGVVYYLSTVGMVLGPPPAGRGAVQGVIAVVKVLAGSGVVMLQGLVGAVAVQGLVVAAV